MNRNEKLKELFLSESFNREAEGLATVEELQALFAKHSMDVTQGEVIELCSQIVQQTQADKTGEISEEALDNVSGGGLFLTTTAAAAVVAAAVATVVVYYKIRGRR